MAAASTSRSLPWLYRTRTITVIAAVTAGSVVSSAIVCALVYLAVGWPLLATDTAGLVRDLVPVLAPLLCAPLVCLPVVRAGRRLAVLLAEVTETQASLEVEIAVRRRLQAELEELATRDSLTELLNRRGFFSAADDFAMPTTVVTVDVDGLKPINDTHGHAAGDAALRAVADALTATAGPQAAVARIGGDEFAALLAPDHVSTHKIRDALSDLEVELPSGTRVTVSASIGVAPVADRAAIDVALGTADRRMYSAKRSETRSGAPREVPGTPPAAPGTPREASAKPRRAA